MTTIVGRVQRLRRMTRMPDFRPETLEKSLEQIEWLIARFVKRATTLLDVSRVITGKSRLELARPDVGGLVREVAENFDPILDYAGSSLAVNVPDRDIIRVCDRFALEQILDNLISNAIKYGAGQPILVRALEDTTSGHVVVQVQDRGLGISPEGQARIFERFERATGEPGGGFGVGLWIVRQLAEAMGGTVTISSRPNEGSTFTVALPLQTHEVS